MLKLIVILQLVLCIFLVSAQTKDWWETASFYHIYPRSFKDSDGDGIGDINGITEKLQYLKEIGITATWLSPIFKSPMADFGYDISDFYSIQPEYGTMEDFDNMIIKANEIGMKIILDFVPNHSSNENDWFIKSEKRIAGFEDFYLWHPGYLNADDTRSPPSNWVSTFLGSAWTFSEIRQEFYYHQFLASQPDLNFRNLLVVQEMSKILRFWLRRGVAGFRVDSIPVLLEVDKDASGNYPDEPLTGATTNPDDPSYTNRQYTLDLPETLDMVYQWREVLDAYQVANDGPTRLLMTEAYASMPILLQYYSDGVDRLGAHIPFNFLMIQSLDDSSNAVSVKSVTDLWLNNMPHANWVIGNHDNSRVASRFGEDRIDIMNMVIQTLPGASVTYNGEEIGMTDTKLSWFETVDPAACNTNSDIYEQYSRDPERTPFQWDSTTSAGFSTNETTWLPVNSNYKTINVEAEEAATISHLKIYKSLLVLREGNTLKYGDVTTKALTDNVFGIARTLHGNTTYITIANFGRQSEVIDLTAFGITLPSKMTYFIVGTSSDRSVGDKVDSTFILTVAASDSFVLSSGASTLFMANVSGFILMTVLLVRQISS